MKCTDCKHYLAFDTLWKAKPWCKYHECFVTIEEESDQAEKDCVGFERKAEVSR